MIIGSHVFPRAPWKTGECMRGCGAWMGTSRSGPSDDGSSPWEACPKNPGVRVRPRAEAQAEINALMRRSFPYDLDDAGRLPGYFELWQREHPGETFEDPTTMREVL